MEYTDEHKQKVFTEFKDMIAWMARTVAMGTLYIRLIEMTGVEDKDCQRIEEIIAEFHSRMGAKQ